MSVKTVGPETTKAADALNVLRQQYGCGPVELTGTSDALYDRHLLFDNVVDPATAGPRQRYEALARSVRDILSQRWVRTEQTYERENPKRVYYLSMEFLIGRSLTNNITNLLLSPLVSDAVTRASLDWLGLARRGARRRTRKWRARASGGVLPRFDGHDAAAGDGVRAPLRVRNVPAIHSRTAGSRSSPTTGFVAPTRGRSPVRTTRSRSG